MRLWLFLGALNALLAVIAGAYGWHWLTVSDTGIRDIFAVGVQYHMWHALALLAVAWLADRGGRRLQAHIAGTAFIVGIILFSGTLYVLGLTGEVPITGAAPVGGVSLMIGWAAVIWAALIRS